MLNNFEQKLKTKIPEGIQVPDNGNHSLSKTIALQKDDGTTETLNVELMFHNGTLKTWYVKFQN